jgi:general secretion pathway protein G
MRRRKSESGFTLVEILVVLVILGLLAALVVPNLIGNVGKAQIATTKTQITNLETALDTFRLDVGRYPNSQEGLQALVERPTGADRWDGPYLKKGVLPKDGWEHPYVYKSPGDRGPYEIASYGADGVAGGDKENADITN